LKDNMPATMVNPSEIEFLNLKVTVSTSYLQIT
jgi:hypothetical protein